MWPDPAGLSLGGMNLPSTFMVANYDWRRGELEKEGIGGMGKREYVGVWQS